jgi:hypothetical protein
VHRFRYKEDNTRPRPSRASSHPAEGLLQRFLCHKIFATNAYLVFFARVNFLNSQGAK